MTVTHLINLRNEVNNNMKYIPIIKKIDRTERKVYNFGVTKNKETFYKKDETKELIEQIESDFKDYIEYFGDKPYDSIIMWCDLGVVCDSRFAKEYVEHIQEHYQGPCDADMLYNHDGKLEKDGFENSLLRANVLDDVVAIRIYDATSTDIDKTDTCTYRCEWEEFDYQSQIYCVRLMDFLNIIKANGYRVLTGDGKPIENFDDYFESFKDFDQVNGFKIIADLTKKQDRVLTKHPKKKKQEEEEE